ncbi:hypothetical protein L596_000847 [Steinernema carpocapsae]|nr:hypothetical protein L596_000847 [Steinernema carpocapsae]
MTLTRRQALIRYRRQTPGPGRSVVAPGGDGLYRPVNRSIEELNRELFEARNPTMSEAKAIKWLPLESNPDIINVYIEKIGVKDAEIIDVYGFDDDLLAFLPQPQHALLLCFPKYKKVDELMRPVYDELIKEGATVPEGLFFMNQKISNACGTFALFHALANNIDKIDLGTGPFRVWYNEALKLSPDARSDLLAQNADLATAHESCAQQGDTTVSIDDNVEHHFICYLHHNGRLLEVDSRMPIPRDCGATTSKSLLKDAGNVCKELMAKLDDVSFCAMALIGK